jgi:hypothetical protein
VNLHLLGRAQPGQNGHDPGNRVFIAEFDIIEDLVAQLHELGRACQMDIPGAANDNGLDAFIAHHGSDAAPAGTGPALLDGSKKDPVFTGQADGRHLGFGLLQLLPG